MTQTQTTDINSQVQAVNALLQAGEPTNISLDGVSVVDRLSVRN